ncbi:insulinase family protein [Candidatus Poribacteria bacterium]|nr:insulinase family protein [Candidatus Poribacteria bacterium]
MKNKDILTQTISFEKYTLSNGLDVILHEDHSIPIVGVNIWYHVGSKNEKRGKTGFAHLFEHMMFQGSQNHNFNYFEPLEKIGGSVNGSTTQDRTNYWENIPKNYLELALWLESDRMGFLLPAMTQERLDNQIDVVKNERRQSYDNQPYGKVSETIASMMYPYDHPYSWPIIGSMEDLSVASLGDVSEFFKTYYTPNNASLCIAGDFDPDKVKELVEKYFGSILPGPPIQRMSQWIPEINGNKRSVLQDNVELSRLFYAWHTPSWYGDGDAEFDLLSDIFCAGKTSRLYKHLVYDLQIAQDVNVYQRSSELGSRFTIDVIAMEGHSLDEIEDELNSQMKEILEEDITPEELEQAKTNWEAGFVRGLEQIGGFDGRADKLNEYNVILGDPDKIQWDIDRYTKPTVEDMRQYTRKWLNPDKCVILHVIPQGELTAKTFKLNRTKTPAITPDTSFIPPKIQHAKTSNGLEILLIENHKIPLVQANIVIKSGKASDPPDQLGASVLTAELIDEGTKSRDALQIADETKNLGAELDTESYFFDGSYVSLNILKKHLNPGLELIADLICNSVFPEDELERQRKIYLNLIQQESKQPLLVAYKLFFKFLYGPEHPYGLQPYNGSGTVETIKAISRKSLLDYYNINYVPNNSAAVIVGDITIDEAAKNLEETFENWKPDQDIRRDISEPEKFNSTKIYIVDKPGATQSAIVMGNLGFTRKNPEYISCMVMNTVLGGQFTSRINMNLREDKGYTYGAGSAFTASKGLGSFMCYAQVHTQATRESIIEIIKEMRDIAGPRPITEDELSNSKGNMIRKYPQRFQTYSGTAGMLNGMVLLDIPEEDWYNYVERVTSVDTDAVTNAARKYLHPDALLIIIVGDRKQIEKEIRGANLGEIFIVDSDGKILNS